MIMGAIKVKEVNLERGSPTVSQAISKMVNELATAKGGGYKSIILIHGYGSSGIGGAIKPAVISKLKEPMLAGVVKSYVNGLNWDQKKKEFIEECSQLKEYENRIQQNPGVTVVLLKR